LTHKLHILGKNPGLFATDDPDSASALPAGKPYAVLCLIALEARGLTRDDLVNFFWADATPERGRASVRQALHVVRKALGAEVLRDDGDRVSVAPGAILIDLLELGEALSTDDLSRALELWDGGPFSRFSLGDAPAFDKWADHVRSLYEDRLGRALLDRAARATGDNDPAEALRWLDLSLDVRPYDEETHAARVEILMDLGRLDDAEHALDEANSVVDEPMVGLFEALRERLKELRRAQLATREPGETRPALQFVGRTSEMAELRAHWKSVLSGRPRSLSILGDAGIGKTRLAEEFLRYTVDPDATVVRAKALDTERTLEFGVVVEVVKELVGRPGAAGISNASLELFRRLIPSLGNGSDTASGTPVSGVSLADAVVDLVEAVSQEGPLAILVDDLQWVDSRSRTLLFRVARSVRGIPVLFLSTCRTGDTDQSALRPLRAEARAGRWSTVELRPLTSLEVRESLASTLRVEPEEDEERLATRLSATSQGNPLFLSELLYTLQRDGVIERQDDEWVLRASRLSEHVPLPSSVWQILEQRLAALDGSERVVVAALAHRGSASPSHLARQAGLPDAQMAQALASLAASGIISWTHDEELTLAHDALREVAASVLPAPAHDRTHRVSWYLAWSAATVVALAFLVLVTHRGTSGRPPALFPFGGSLIYARRDQAVLEIRPPALRGGAWREDTLAMLDSAGGVSAVWQGRNGAQRIINSYTAPSGRATAQEVLPDGSTRELLHYAGDVNINDISPDGRYALLSVADETGPTWALDLAHFSLSDGRVTIIRHLGEGSARWVRDGSGIVALVRAQPDTLLLLRPDGRTLWSSVAAPTALDVGVPCAFSRDEAVSAQVLSSHLPVLNVYRRGQNEADVNALAPLENGVVCSPQGHAVGYVGIVDGVTRLVLQDLDTGDTLLGPTGTDKVLRWRRDHPLAVPVAVHADEDTARLQWGERKALDASVRFSDGTAREDTLVSWRSLDPHVAYVTKDGTVFGNGGGRTKAVASVYGWMADTVDIVVSADRAPSDALLADRFVTFDTTKWAVLGDPSPAAVSLTDGPALDMRGDGVGADGIRSRTGFDLTKGATLELEFRLPLTRRDRQSIGVCLEETSGEEEAGTAATHAPIRPTDRVCFEHPRGELAAFDSTTYSFFGLVPAGRISRPDLFPSNDWRHLAIVLAPDGRATLFIDRKHIADLPLPLSMHPGDRWHVLIVDRAADTRAMIRNLLLWQGMRY
jgi:DNA-binding SARP family transcriptional activator